MTNLAVVINKWITSEVLLTAVWCTFGHLLLLGNRLTHRVSCGNVMRKCIYVNCSKKLKKIVEKNEDKILCFLTLSDVTGTK